jgi:hypothetical protein
MLKEVESNLHEATGPWVLSYVGELLFLQIIIFFVNLYSMYSVSPPTHIELATFFPSFFFVESVDELLIIIQNKLLHL